MIDHAFEECLRHRRAAFTMHHVARPLLQHLQRFWKPSLQHQNRDAAKGKHSLGIDSGRSVGQCLLGLANVALPLEGQLRLHRLQAERMRRCGNAAIVGLIRLFVSF